MTDKIRIVHGLFKVALFFTLVTCLTTVTAAAQSAQQKQSTTNNLLTKTHVDSFYNNCMQQSHEDITHIAKDVFCSCSAKKLFENVSLEELRHYTAYTPKGKKTPPPIVSKVFIPCLPYAVSDHSFQKCMSNEFHAQQGLCLCLGDYMGLHTVKNAKRVLAPYLEQFSTMKNPVKTFISDPFYKKRYKKGTLYCFQNKQKSAQ